MIRYLFSIFIVIFLFVMCSKDNRDVISMKEFKSGKDKLFGFFVGQVMKISGGKANPKLVNEILKKKLKWLKQNKLKGQLQLLKIFDIRVL